MSSCCCSLPPAPAASQVGLLYSRVSRNGGLPVRSTFCRCRAAAASAAASAAAATPRQLLVLAVLATRLRLFLLLRLQPWAPAALHSPLRIPPTPSQAVLARRRTRRRVRRCSPAAAVPPAVASAAAEEFASGQRKVELIVSDVDGTLLNPRQQLSPGNRRAVAAAAAAGVPLALATGKAMGPWCADVLPHLGSRLPQVRWWEGWGEGGEPHGRSCLGQRAVASPACPACRPVERLPCLLCAAGISLCPLPCTLPKLRTVPAAPSLPPPPLHHHHRRSTCKAC